jgi:hypothetical protein
MNLREEIKIFAERLSVENQETKEALQILNKYLRGEELTDEEKRAFKEQFYDILKMAGLSIPLVILPCSSVLIPLVVVYMRKKGVNLLPSAFDDRDEQFSCSENFVNLKLPDMIIQIQTLNVEVQEIKKRPNDQDLGKFVRSLLTKNEENEQRKSESPVGEISKNSQHGK